MSEHKGCNYAEKTSQNYGNYYVAEKPIASKLSKHDSLIVWDEN